MLDIDVYGGIGDEFDEGGVTAVSFVRALRDADGEDVTIHINSSGGSVFDANTMAEALRGYKGHTTASIEGLAASAASYFALTADDVVINQSALMMIHNPWDFAVGDADDMRKKADMLDKARSTISAQYARKTGRTVDEIEELMDAETWFTAQEAVEFGLVDRMSDSEPIAACVSKRRKGRRKGRREVCGGRWRDYRRCRRWKGRHGVRGGRSGGRCTNRVRERSVPEILRSLHEILYPDP